MLKILYSPRFAKRFKKLSQSIKEKAIEKEKIFRQNPFDGRLRTHKLHGEMDNCWAFSVDYSTRIIFSFENNEIIHFHTIGSHDLYHEL